MHHRVVIMEIKKDYVIALKEDGEMVKIKYKDGLDIGDKIYILDEDIINDRKDILPINTTIYKRIALCMMVLVVSLFIFNTKRIDTYAMVSIDGDNSLELRVDKNGKIQDAASLNNSYSDNELKEMKGKHIKDLDLNDSKVVSIASFDDDLDKEFEEEILSVFSDDIYYIKACKDDIKLAKDNNTSLGKYLLSKAINEDQLEEILEEKTVSELYEMLKNNPELINDEDIIDILEDKLEDQSDDEIDDETVDEIDDEDEGSKE